tara:strand:+ start:486 stop:614 length:129 start_codon:yes stop_codon:yes gene_type:complete
MKILKSFLTEAEALQFIEKHRLSDAIIEHDFLTGRYNVLDMS